MMKGAFISNLFKSTQTAAGLKAFKPVANERYLINVQIITRLFPCTVQKYMYPPVSKVHAGTFRVSVIFSCALDGIRISVLRILSPTLYQLSHPVAQQRAQI